MKAKEGQTYARKESASHAIQQLSIILRYVFRESKTKLQRSDRYCKAGGGFIPL